MDNVNLHIVVFPWLAFGHLLPFTELSKRLARYGHRVSFISTPKNIARVFPKLPSQLSDLINLVEFRLPIVEHLPEDVEATIDLPSDGLRPYLRRAYDSLDHQLRLFLKTALPSKPDWIIVDYAAHWVPAIAEEFDVPCAYFSVVNAAVLGFIGPPASLMGVSNSRTTPEQFAELPEWVNFPTTVAYRGYEAQEIFEQEALRDGSGVSETYRFGKTIQDCQIVAVRSCSEFEQEWFNLLEQIYRKPVIPVGLLPPLQRETSFEEEWKSTMNWLEKQTQRSVVFAAFGSEAKLTSAQTREIAIGLESCGLPFIWALRDSSGLPKEFKKRVDGRGEVLTGWVPQSQILAHPAIGGFLTHAGWSSIIEGLGLGLKLVLLPLVFDQGLNARHMVEKRISMEVPRDEEDGSFNGDGIAKTLRLVMVDEEGEAFRTKVEECREMFGNEELNDQCVRDFLKYLSDHKRNSDSSKMG
ncbi:UDP-glycosyltransferase 91C1-like [Typha angustifolia]|uniref:UDP-glycosyltransferase 91C1-like n=1 Tax=Typha angustifolia TaxID=59011 RepID=UPI003C2B2B61